MAYNGDIPSKYLDKLDKYWLESKSDRDIFFAKISSDKEMMKRNSSLNYWKEIARRRVKGYKESKPSKKTFPYENLPADKFERLLSVLRDDTPWSVVQSEFPQFERKVLYHLAKNNGIKINKKKAAKAAKQELSSTEKPYETRLKELIASDTLKKGGIEGIVSVIKGEFPAEVKDIAREELTEKIEALIWSLNKDELELLTKFVRGGFDLAPIYKRLGDVIPKEIIDAKAKVIRGLRPGGTQKKSTIFEAGIGRIATDNEVEQIQSKGIVELQHHTLESPFKITVKNQNPGNFQVMVIDGPHLGLEYNRVLDENTLRNAFRHAQRVGVDAIVITAGLMWTDMKKSSGRLTTHRALYNGLDFDPEVMDPEYRAEAIEIRKNLPPDRIGFTTLRERVMNAFGGWRKVTSHKNGSPIFEGPVYFSFGYPEEEMSENTAHEHLRYLKSCMELEARAERIAKEAELHYEMKMSDGEETAEVKRLVAEVQRLLRLEKRKSANTNIEKLDQDRFTSVMQSLLISWYKEAIPNAEFMGQGSVVCDIGGQKVEILQAAHEHPTEHDVTNLIRSIGQRDLDGRVPDVILGAGAYNLNSRWSAREYMRGTETDQVHVWQLPVLIDRDYVRGAKAEMIKKGSPIERLIGDGRFEPGAFMLSMVDGVWNSHPLPISMFTQRFPKTRVRSGPPKEIIHYVEGDQHTGNPNKESTWDERNQEWLPMEVAASEIFMREFVEKGQPLPFHIFSSHGDSTQGRHYPTEQNRHPQHESGGSLESESAELLRKIRDGNIKPNELKEATVQIVGKLNRQIRLRGEHWYQQQLEDFVDHSLERRARFFLEILKRGKSASIQLRGIKQVLTDDMNAHERRDVGRVSILDGNHGQRTTEGTVAEAWFFARILLLSIFAEKDCPFTRKDLQWLVRAPIWGNIASAYGLVSAAGGYEWGLHLRHDPTRKSGQDGDPLAQATRNLAERGDYGYIFNKHEFVCVVGDQHRYAAAYAPRKKVFNCACNTHGDSYGDDWGFSKSNLGGMIICLPVDGPGAGPVRMIPISHTFIKKFMAKPWKIDWAKLFPNPA